MLAYVLYILQIPHEDPQLGLLPVLHAGITCGICTYKGSEDLQDDAACLQRLCSMVSILPEGLGTNRRETDSV